jgi:hypothetical protein
MSLADGDDDSGDLSDLLGVGNIGKAAVEVGELSMPWYFHSFRFFCLFQWTLEPRNNNQLAIFW